MVSYEKDEKWAGERQKTEIQNIAVTNMVEILKYKKTAFLRRHLRIWFIINHKQKNTEEMLKKERVKKRGSPHQTMKWSRSARSVNKETEPLFPEPDPKLNEYHSSITLSATDLSQSPSVSSSYLGSRHLGIGDSPGIPHNLSLDSFQMRQSKSRALPNSCVRPIRLTVRVEHTTSAYKFILY